MSLPPAAELCAPGGSQQIADWFGRSFGWNLAIATGVPGPDVLDVDQHGEAGNGYAAFARLRRAAWPMAPPRMCGPRPAGAQAPSSSRQVHFLLTRRRCQVSRVPGVTIRCNRRRRQQSRHGRDHGTVSPAPPSGARPAAARPRTDVIR